VRLVSQQVTVTAMQGVRADHGCRIIRVVRAYNVRCRMLCYNLVSKLLLRISDQTIVMLGVLQVAFSRD